MTCCYRTRGPNGPVQKTAGEARVSRAPAHPELEEALVRARDGDEAAFVALYRHIQPMILRYTAALVGGEAEDVTAEAWLQVTRDLHRFEGTLDGFRGWVATIARHRALDHLRARSRRPVTLDDLAMLADRPGSDDTAADAIDRMQTARAVALVATLPREQAEAVLLRAVVGLDVPTAAEVLGKRPVAVRVAAHRGLKRLAAALGTRPATLPDPTQASGASAPAAGTPVRTPSRSGRPAAGPAVALPSLV